MMNKILIYLEGLLDLQQLFHCASFPTGIKDSVLTSEKTGEH